MCILYIGVYNVSSLGGLVTSTRNRETKTENDGTPAPTSIELAFRLADVHAYLLHVEVRNVSETHERSSRSPI